MTRSARDITCPIHGAPRHRASCRECNAAYMRSYLRRRARERPAKVMWERARRRARRLGVTFNLPKDSIRIPELCPVLAIPIEVGERRSNHSPSLDRIVPENGYVPGNVRVISDRANRLKGDRSLTELQHRARENVGSLHKDYERTAAYLERELLLQQVRTRAAAGGRAETEWQKVAAFLEKVFSAGPIV